MSCLQFYFPCLGTLHELNTIMWTYAIGTSIRGGLDERNLMNPFYFKIKKDLRIRTRLFEPPYNESAWSPRQISRVKFVFCLYLRGQSQILCKKNPYPRRIEIWICWMNNEYESRSIFKYRPNFACTMFQMCPKSVTVAKCGVRSARYLENLIRNGIHNVSEKSLHTS